MDSHAARIYPGIADIERIAQEVKILNSFDDVYKWLNISQVYSGD
jgi:hypothetical protein